MQTVVFLVLRKAAYSMHIIVIIFRLSIWIPLLFFLLSRAPAQIASFDQFSLIMAQKMYFCAIYALFRVRMQTNFLKIFFLIFPQKSEILYSQNVKRQYFGYIQDKALKSARSRACLAMTDRIVWLPSLSRDRKWPRTPITLWLCVTRVAYKLEQKTSSSAIAERPRCRVV